MADKIADLVARGATLKREIKAKQEALKDIETLIHKHGPGTHADGRGASCTVVPKGVTFEVSEANLDAVKKAAGAQFKTLFATSTAVNPVKSFRDVVLAVLSKAKAAKLLGLIEKPRAAFIKWSIPTE